MSRFAKQPLNDTSEIFKYNIPKNAFVSPKVKASLKTSSFGGTILVSKKAVIILSSVLFLVVIGCIATGLSIGVSKAPYNTTCNSLRQCDSSEKTTCSASEHKCLCNSFEYWKNLKCNVKKNINETCEDSNECRDDLYLNCQSNLCSCRSTHVWNNTNCVNKRIYNESCIRSTDCAEYLNLTCLMNKCDCTSPTSLFWNNKQCEIKRDFNKTCETNDWCNSVNNSLQCITTSWETNSVVGVCSCNSSQYYSISQQKCLTVKTYGSTSCASNSECDTLNGQTCLSGTCSCSSSQYFDGALCVNKVSNNALCQTQSTTFGQVPICNDNMGLLCINTRCSCNSTQFWSSIHQKCINYLGIGSQCSSSSECLQSISLVCSNGFCQCNTTQYFDSVNTFRCQNKLANGSSCSSHTMCQSYNGLYCRSSICLCNLTETWYPNPGVCSPVQRLCSQYYNLGIRTDGLYPIYVNSTLTKTLRCDMTRGGWTVIAAKYTPPALVGNSQFIAQFDKSWFDFKHGFGTANVTYWSGLDFMNYLTSSYSLQYRIDAWNSASDFVFIVRNSIFINNEANKYRLALGSPTSFNVPSVHTGANGMFFTTFDSDNDVYGGNCANNPSFVGGWWHSSCYSDCITCTNQFQFNYNPGNIYDGTRWRFFDFFEMKVL